jgi:hypothetical protein
MELRVGDRLVSESGEWEVAGRPFTTAGEKTAQARVKKVNQPEVTEIRSWGAHERVSVKPSRASDDATGRAAWIVSSSRSAVEPPAPRDLGAGGRSRSARRSAPASTPRARPREPLSGSPPRSFRSRAPSRCSSPAIRYQTLVARSWGAKSTGALFRSPYPWCTRTPTRQSSGDESDAR